MPYPDQITEIAPYVRTSISELPSNISTMRNTHSDSETGKLDSDVRLHVQLLLQHRDMGVYSD